MKRSRLWLGLTIGNAPLLATIFLAVNPYLLWYGQDGKMYALTPFLALLAAWFWLQGIGRGGWRPWLGYLLVVSIAMYSHLLMVMLIPLGILWFLVAWPQSRKHKLGYLLALAGLTLPYLPMVWWQWFLLTHGEHVTGMPTYTLLELLEKVLVTQSYGVLEPAGLLELAPVFFLGAAGLILGSLEILPVSGDSLPRLTPVRRHLIVVAWLLIPVLTIYLFTLRQPVFNPHYVIWIAPAAMMLLALGVQLLWSNSGPLAKPLAMALSLYVLVFWITLGQQQRTGDIKPDLRAAVQYIDSRRQPEGLLIVQAPYMETAYRYYSSDQGPYPFQGSNRRLGQWAGGLWTNNGLGDSEARQHVNSEMEAMTGGAKDIWVMLSEAETWDERGLMLEWLDERAALVDEASFRLAAVRHYRLP